MSSTVDIPEPETVLRALGADDGILSALAATLADPATRHRCREGGPCRSRAVPAPLDQGGVPVATSGVSPVCVGDWCTATRTPERGAGSYALTDVVPRRTALVRQSSGSRVESQALATNMDTVMVVVPLDRAISRRQIERFLALAWDSGAQPVLVLTKADLVDHDTVTAAVAEVSAVSGDLAVLLVSVLTGSGMTEVGALVTTGHTVALLGTSGSGKSSLVNALMGSEVVQTGEVRQADSKGRHTTTWRELVVVPTGGALIDTPGLREWACGSTKRGSTPPSPMSPIWPPSAASTTAPT